MAAENILSIDWGDSHTYCFQYDKKLDRGLKDIYYGFFVENAPDNLEVGTQYCLKMIQAKDSALPQRREMFELVNFQGQHLREILARNKAAEQIAETLKRNGHFTGYADGCVVEPIYAESRELFRNCSQYSVVQRLDVVRQYGLGSEELGSSENALGNRHIVAHRDLKASNGVLDPYAEGIHIRLIDFASVALERDQFLQSDCASSSTDAYIADGSKQATHETPMSPSNTSPELLMPQRYPVSTKTDVYSLGMLLASLFVTYHGSYINPSSVWCREVGWEDESAQNKLCERFQHCAQMHEPNASASRTWIEQDLHSRGITLNWELMSNDSIRQAIRDLFFRATRINPKDRIDRSEFIATLNELIQRAQDTQTHTQIPVSLYLIDQQDISLLRAAYTTAAVRAFEMDQEDARRRGETPPLALCLCYRKELRSNEDLSSFVQLLTDNPCGNISELSSVIRKIRDAKGTGSDRLAFALYRAYTHLDNANQLRFTGKIHLLAPQVPLLRNMANVDRYGLSDICGPSGLGSLCDYPVQIFAHSIVAPEEDPDEDEWCSNELISGIPKPVVHLPQSHDTQASEPSPAVHSAADQPRSNTDGSYILLNGKKIYIS